MPPSPCLYSCTSQSSKNYGHYCRLCPFRPAVRFPPPRRQNHATEIHRLQRPCCERHVERSIATKKTLSYISYPKTGCVTNNQTRNLLLLLVKQEGPNKKSFPSACNKQNAHPGLAIALTNVKITSCSESFRQQTQVTDYSFLATEGQDVSPVNKHVMSS